MKLRHLFEAQTTEVAIIFGRFNPPHKGHKAAWELASKSPVWFVGTNESTVGPKDPLPFEVKVEAMKAIWPEVESHIVAETSWLTLASKVYEQYPDATLLCLTDEEWVTKTIVQYNGKEGAHGFYNFKNITQKPTPRLSSATALRDAVTKGDREAFAQAAGVSADTPVAGKPFFDLVAEYLLPYSNAPVKKVAKKKVAAPVETVTEAEGDPEGLPHLTKDLLQHIVKQVGKEGAHAIIKSLTWGDGAAKELLHLIVNDLEDDIEGMDEDVQEEPGPQHRVSVKITDPNTYDDVQKVVRVEAKDKQDALDQVEEFYAKKDIYIVNIKYLGMVGQTVPETIKKVGSQYELVSKKGKNLGKYPTRVGAEKREKQVNYFKHATEDAAGVGIITKQNSTADVNKNTPRKNLKAFKLVK